MIKPIIEENIPIPPKRNKWTFIKDMKIGDSFFIKFQDCPKSFQGGFLSTIAQRYEIKLTVRKSADGYRVWRIE